ncbi:cytochrome P450 [Sorangium sp. So ce887]|uniref:cytochrome P450 n=1 Tax=Sorangium sp. So ce887 TaxID=3133324 RepID=UPI003F5EEED2
MRQSAPVCQVEPGGLWAVSRYNDVAAVLSDSAVFSSAGLREATRPSWLGHNPVADSLALLDPPVHTKLRALVNKAFSIRVVPRVEPLVRAAARRFADSIVSGQPIEVQEHFSSELPGVAIAELLGLDPALRRLFVSWSEALFSIHPATPPEHHARIRAVIADIESYLREVLADRRRSRRDDLASDLLDAEVDGKRLSEAELISFLAIVLQGGHDTIASLLASSLRCLAGRPELLARLRAEPTAIPSFIEEMLRFDPPLQASTRLTASDTELSGVSLPRGSIVLALIGSANRDDRHIKDPDRVDLKRQRNAGLSFGLGAHFCIGAALSRAEGRIGLEELLPRIQGLRMHERGSAWSTSLFSRNQTLLWMEFDRA